jgi:[ribosomal protein S18]-alanine N-acetyltransferase
VIGTAGPGDAAALAGLHARVWPRPWSEAEFRRLLGEETTLALRAGPAALPDGFAVFAIAADEAELLMIGVDARARRAGLGQALLAAGLSQLEGRGARTVFLEVAADNGPALSLYAANGFRQAGIRRGYYPGADGGRMDALLLSRPLGM